MLFGMWAWVDPNNHVLDGSLHPPEKGAILGVGIHGQLSMPAVGIFNKTMQPFTELLQFLVLTQLRVQ